MQSRVTWLSSKLYEFYFHSGCLAARRHRQLQERQSRITNVKGYQYGRLLVVMELSTSFAPPKNFSLGLLVYCEFRGVRNSCTNTARFGNGAK
jgi:hypothetical protein